MLKEQMLVLQRRGAQHPAEHSVGHLYKRDVAVYRETIDQRK